MDYPNNLAQLRAKLPNTPSVTEIAVKMGVSHSTAYDWESGKRFPRNTRIMLPVIERAYKASRSEIWPHLYGNP